MQPIRIQCRRCGPSGGRDCRYGRSAFGLKELLAVIAVISVVVALFLSWLGPAMRKARQARCAQNARELGLAVHTFVADFHAYPLYSNSKCSEGSYPEHQTDWIVTLQGVLARADSTKATWPARTVVRRLWLCPSAPRPTGASTGMTYRSYGYNGYGLSTDSTPGTASFGLGGHYGWNAGPDGSMGPPVRESEVARPSQMMLLGDGLEGGKGIVVDGLMLLRRNDGMAASPATTARALARHAQRANVAFADGHVDTLALKRLFEEESDATLSRWNRDDRPHPELLAR